MKSKTATDRQLRETASARPAAPKLTAAEMKVLERLIEDGALVAVPRAPAKPHKVMAASLAEGGTRVMLYLAAKPTKL